MVLLFGRVFLPCGLPQNCKIGYGEFVAFLDGGKVRSLLNLAASVPSASDGDVCLQSHKYRTKPLQSKDQPQTASRKRYLASAEQTMYPAVFATLKFKAPAPKTWSVLSEGQPSKSAACRSRALTLTLMADRGRAFC